MLGLITGYAVLNTIPSIFLYAPTTAPPLSCCPANNTCCDERNRLKPYIVFRVLYLTSCCERYFARSWSLASGEYSSDPGAIDWFVTSLH